MKKWFKFFHFSFFSHKLAKEGAKRGYASFFLSFILTLVFLWTGFIGGDMLPFSAHYNNSPDFKAVTRLVFANPDLDKRIQAEIENGALKVKKNDVTYVEDIIVNTASNENDKQNYSVNGYIVVIDTRPADTLAEVEAYCISNDGNDLIISYEEYLTLSAVARLNILLELTAPFVNPPEPPVSRNAVLLRSFPAGILQNVSSATSVSCPARTPRSAPS